MKHRLHLSKVAFPDVGTLWPMRYKEALPPSLSYLSARSVGFLQSKRREDMLDTSERVASWLD